jgi:hypothetical protein
MNYNVMFSLQQTNGLQVLLVLSGIGKGSLYTADFLVLVTVLNLIRIGNQVKIQRQQVVAFWDWFGQVLTTIRFKRHVKALWSNGYLLFN